MSSAVMAEKALAELPSREVRRLRERTEYVLATAGSDFTLYLSRAAVAFDRVRQDLPNHAAGALADWFRLFASKEGLLKTGPGSEHERLKAFLEARTLVELSEDTPVPVLLDHAILAPAESLDGIHGLVKDTANLVDSLVAYLAQHESAGSGVQDAAAVLEFGKRIATKASELKAVLS
jgi:hypothetical protein